MKTFGVDGAAALLNISPDTMKDLAQRGIVPGAKIGKCWLFTDEDLEAYVREEVKLQTAARRKLSGIAVTDPVMATSIVPTTFSRTVRRRPMEPPQLTPPMENSAPKRGRLARIPPPLPKQ